MARHRRHHRHWYQHLGLPADPFAGPAPVPYCDGERARLLGEILLATASAPPLLAITGPAGIGKSVLRTSAPEHVEKGAICLELRGHVFLEPASLTRQLWDAWSVTTGAMAKETASLRELGQAMAAALKQGASISILVDDADELPDASLKLLVNLGASLAKRPLRLVLFGREALAARLADHEKVGLFQLETVPPLDDGDVANYLTERLRFSATEGASPLAFTDRELEHIAHRSMGVPGQIDAEARQTLRNRVHGIARPRSARRRRSRRSLWRRALRWMRKHLAISGTAAALLVLMLVAWALVGGATGSAPPAPAARQLTEAEDPMEPDPMPREDTTAELNQQPAGKGPDNAPPPRVQTPELVMATTIANAQASPADQVAEPVDDAELSVTPEDPPPSSRRTAAPAQEAPAITMATAIEASPPAIPPESAETDGASASAPAPPDVAATEGEAPVAMISVDPPGISPVLTEREAAPRPIDPADDDVEAVTEAGDAVTTASRSATPSDDAAETTETPAAVGDDAVETAETPRRAEEEAADAGGTPPSTDDAESPERPRPALVATTTETTATRPSRPSLGLSRTPSTPTRTSSRAIAGEREILSMPGDALVLQVMVLSSATRAALWLAEQSGTGSYATYRRGEGSDPVWVILQGPFTDRSAAELAAREIEQRTGIDTPWIRSVTEVQAEMQPR